MTHRTCSPSADQPPMNTLSDLDKMLNTARVWDLSGAVPEAVELGGHTKSVNTASFSPDGKSVVTASDDGNAIIHAVPTDDELVVLATHSITRCLTVDQREQLGLPVLISGAPGDRARIRPPPC